MTEVGWPHAILAVVVAQRIGELILARRNTQRLLADGAYETGAGHYPLIVAVHTAWLAALLVMVDGSTPISVPLLGVFIVLQAGRVWVIATLGRYWTTRIIVVPNAPLIRSGPYRFVRHPNYCIVAAEIAVLPMMFGLWWVAVVFTVLNAVVLTIRIRAETATFGGRPG